MSDIVDLYQLYDGRIIEDEDQSKIMYTLFECKPWSSTVFTMDEIGLATMLGKIFNDKYRYCLEDRLWYYFDGASWKKTRDTAMISDEIQTVLNLMLLSVSEVEHKHPELDLKAYSSFVKKCRNNTFINHVLELFKTQSRFFLTDFDEDPYVLNTPIRAYKLSKQEEMDTVNRFERMLSQVTTCNVREGEKVCNRWYKFIKEITCGDDELASFLQRALGYSILGDNKEECMFIAYGKKTRNGKGTLFSSILNALGDEYAQSSDPQLICEKPNGMGTDFNAPQPALRKLVGTRLVVMAESKKGVMLDAASMKALTGRDRLSTRGLFETPFDFYPQFTMWLNTNYLPAVNDETIFMSDRVWVIPFNAHFDEESRDTDLKTLFSLPENKPTILEWLVDGCQDYLINGLKVPESVEEETIRYRNSFDRVGMFLREKCVLDSTQKIKRGELYSKYCSWCASEDNRFKPVGSTTFYADIENRGFKLHKVGGYMYFVGISDEEPIPGRIKLI